MRKLNLWLLIASLLLACACNLAITSVPSQPSNREDILVKVHVLMDSPPPGSNYVLMKGEPKRVGVYEFYLKDPGLPGSGRFTRLDSISLKRLSSTELYGENQISRISGTLCIGYPSTNIIDGKAIVELDQSKTEIEITVHYWKTSLGIL